MNLREILQHKSLKIIVLMVEIDFVSCEYETNLVANSYIYIYIYIMGGASSQKKQYGALFFYTLYISD